jgi:hypothetical protein
MLAPFRGRGVYPEIIKRLATAARAAIAVSLSDDATAMSGLMKMIEVYLVD